MIPDRLQILCCPQCKGDLAVLDSIRTAGGRLKSAALVCSRCQEAVGEVVNFKYDFLHFDRDRLRARASRNTPLQLPYEVSQETVGYADPRLELEGEWQPWEGRYQQSEGAPGSRLRLETRCTDIGVRLIKHPWSGWVRFRVDGQVVGESDLYQPSFSTVTWFPIANDLDGAPHVVEIETLGRRHERSNGTQVFFHDFVVTRPARKGEVVEPRLRSENRVLALWDEVVEMMKTVPDDGLILDHGGGDRTMSDPRYVNAEYTHYELPHVYADALYLPFKDNTFDFVMSQAVLEHVPDPFRAVEEIRRVTKVGGKVWAGFAFMQPVHAVPYHYFNSTAWGAEHLFQNMTIERLSWSGDLSFTIDWMCKAVGLGDKVEAERYRAVMDEIKSWDKLITYEELRDVASGVAVIARKR